LEQRKYAAFFDIDETIIRINSSRSLVKRAHRTGMMGNRDLVRAIYQVFLYKYNLKDTLKIIHKMGSWIAGVKVDHMKAIVAKIFETDILPAIRPAVVDEIERHRSQGAELIILSSAISIICQLLSDHLRFDRVICTVMEESGGYFTGRPVGKFCFRDEKLVRLKAYCAENGYSLSETFYYADSIDDAPAFLQVGHPVCVSPDRKLSRLAAQKGWTVIDG